MNKIAYLSLLFCSSISLTMQRIPSILKPTKGSQNNALRNLTKQAISGTNPLQTAIAHHTADPDDASDAKYIKRLRTRFVLGQPSFFKKITPESAAEILKFNEQFIILLYPKFTL